MLTTNVVIVLTSNSHKQLLWIYAQRCFTKHGKVLKNSFLHFSLYSDRLLIKPSMHIINHLYVTAHLGTSTLSQIFETMNTRYYYNTI